MQGAQLQTFGAMQPATVAHGDPNAVHPNDAPPTYAPGPNMKELTDGYLQHMAAAERDFFAKHTAAAPAASVPQMRELALELPPSARSWSSRVQAMAAQHALQAQTAPVYETTAAWNGVQPQLPSAMGIAPQILERVHEPVQMSLERSVHGPAPTHPHPPSGITQRSTAAPIYEATAAWNGVQPQPPATIGIAPQTRERAHDPALMAFEHSVHGPAPSYPHPSSGIAQRSTALIPGDQRKPDVMDVDYPHAPPPQTAPPSPFIRQGGPMMQPTPVTSRHSSIAHALGPLSAYNLTPAPPYAPALPGATTAIAPTPLDHPHMLQIAHTAQPGSVMQAASTDSEPQPSLPTYTMYGSLKVLDEPAGGWPRWYGAGYDSLFRGLARTKKEVWRRFKPESELLIRLGSQTDFFAEGAFVKAAKALVFRFVAEVSGEAGFTIISPEKDLKQLQDGVFPAVWFAYKLTRVGIARVRARLVWHTEDGTFHIPLTYTGASPYIATYRGFGNTDEAAIKDAAVALFATKERIDSLAKILGDDNGAQKGISYQDLAREVIKGIEVSAYRELCEDEKEEGEIVASIYCEPPVSEAYHGAWFLWTRALTTVTIEGAYVDGSGEPATARQCASCHGGDHDFRNCPFRKIPGFHGTLRLDVSGHGATWSTVAPGEAHDQLREEPSSLGPHVYYRPDMRPMRPPSQSQLQPNPQTRPRAHTSAPRRPEWEEPRRNSRSQQWNQTHHYHNNAHAGPSRNNYTDYYDEYEDAAYRPAHNRPHYENNRGRHQQQQPPQQTRPPNRNRRSQRQPDQEYPQYDITPGNTALLGTRLDVAGGVRDLPADRNTEDGDDEIGGSTRDRADSRPEHAGQAAGPSFLRAATVRDAQLSAPELVARSEDVPESQEEGAGRTRRRKVKSKARICVASLNIRGYGAENKQDGSSKWMSVNQLMRDKKIAVLALQETHLNDERAALINRVFDRSMSVLFSPDPTNSTGAKGVAFAINRRVLKDCSPSIRTLIPGRAILLTLPWSEDRSLTILNVYAPNDSAENAAFWNGLSGMRLGRVDLVLGDYNIVEDKADRLPPREDPEAPRLALRAFCDKLSVLDGWRAAYPLAKGYTFLQESTSAQSRLDRIYARRAMLRDCSEWAICPSGIPTDHLLVSTAVENYKAPFHGRGRWIMPTHLLNDEEMKKTMKSLGTTLLTRLDGIRERSLNENPQLLYADFKKELIAAARARAKAKVPKLQKKLDNLKADLERIANDPIPGHPDQSAETTRAEKAAIIQDRIMALEKKRFGWRRKEVAARHWTQSETMSKYWMRGNTTPEVSETMYTMRQPNTSPPTYTNHTRTMAEIARNYYDGIQLDDPLEEGEDHETYIDEALADTDARLSNGAKAALAERLDRDDIVDATKAAATGKAPGLDGIPTEVWKAYNRWYEADTKRGRQAVDMPRAMARVYNDIEIHGLIKDSDFAQGWICPVYKLKKDKREISSYRPITLLNSDYKLLTKALASKLAAVAPSVIHEDQAGFIPGRRIFDHIKLSQLVIEYAEAEELNGAIVALDQEKAYDKIDHAYLWRVLQHMNFPMNFIRTLQHLYGGAISCVMVNGVRSKFFRVVRGVRQGDPISCLIFNLAIEPLACALRKSSLRGLRLPGAADRLIAKLFADDTTVYLGKDDEYAMMQNITDKWCRAARARFNNEKTEVLPIGSRAYRKQVIETRRLTSHSSPIPDTAHIVHEGEAIRLLGAWIGNDIDQAAPWLPILDQIETNLAKWGKARPTLHGRKLAVGIELAGRTQFRAMVQTMPPSVEKRLARIEADFVWNGDTRPRIARDQLYKPIDEGGLNLLDISVRNDAIQLMWLRSYLAIGINRPQWATIADALLARAVAADSRNVDPAARINTFLQTWNVSTRATAGMPRCLKEMIKAAKKYSVRCVANNPSRALRKQVPVWYHIGRNTGRCNENTEASRCLRNSHQVRTVDQCERVAARLTRDGTTHVSRAACPCPDCDTDRTRYQCINPHRCAATAARLLNRLSEKWNLARDENCDGLTLTTGRKRENKTARLANDRILFNPTVSTDEPIATAFRVFVPSSNGETTAALRPARPFQIGAEAVEVFTDGSARGNGSGNAVAGSGVWFGEGDPRNSSERVPYDSQSNQVAEIYAVAMAHRLTPPFAPMHIVSDSRYVTNGLTEHLPRWEERGWIGVANADILREVVGLLRTRSAPTTFKWVKGHAGARGNEQADRLAAAGAACPRPMRPLHLPPPERYMIGGAALSKLSQRLAYQGIQRWNAKECRPTTARHIRTVQHDLLQATGERPLEQAVWNLLRKKPISRKARDFIWKALHGGHRIGSYWNHIPGYEERANCVHCGVAETMEHILCRCTAPGPAVAWALARGILNRKSVTLPDVTLGIALGGHAFTVCNEDGTPRHGATRLARIVLTETAYLIWVLRCDRVVGERASLPGDAEVRYVENRWLQAITRRLNTDRTLTRKRTVGKWAVPPAVVLATWEKTIHKEERLPSDWINSQEVLVGKPLRMYAPDGG
ncbi:Transposon TX1 uncharacterized 149 kDa protein [Trametes pubescens]|uniref:Transposon TX1 uncharacterized 149 kDa protein n=1 Tax=Trametes pubescens TaxID=154538 RepID=A0A1M2V1Y2_TRAPU|nr:Transposon TX1 uncharacterized 149 kDa protein [Trametes pubescens]